MTYRYDNAGNRTRITWPDASPNTLYAAYSYDMLNRVTQIGENGATSGVGLLASYTYDDHGRRTNIARAGGAGPATVIGYDASDRVARLTQNFAASAADVVWTPTYSYNPSPQAVTVGSTNDAYAYHAAVISRPYTTNGLNQYTMAGANALTYDARGNLLTNNTYSYTYDPENHLLTASAPTAVTLTYDPIGQLQTSATASATTTFLYAGDALVGEYDGSGTILRRYVPGPGTDEPLVWYEGAGTGDRRWLHADTQNSVIGYSDSSGNSGATYAYDPYGLPDTWSATASRYRYTGQTLIPEAHLYDYKARMYDPMAGRFLQTDPVGYDSDINLYAYAGNDPINWFDPTGDYCDDITATTSNPDGSYQAPGGLAYECHPDFGVSNSTSGAGSSGSGGGGTIGKPKRAGLQPPQSKLPDCNTVLPNGQTIGDLVHTVLYFSQSVSQGNPAQQFGAQLAMAAPYGPLDPKNNFRGQAPANELADEGNFAVGAYMTAVWGSGASNLAAIIYATGSNLLGIKPSRFMAPNGMDTSAAANLPRGNASAGCPVAR